MYHDRTPLDCLLSESFSTLMTADAEQPVSKMKRLLGFSGRQQTG